MSCWLKRPNTQEGRLLCTLEGRRCCESLVVEVQVLTVLFMACYARLVQLHGGLVADPGVPGGDRAGLGLDFAVHGVLEVCPEEYAVQVDALVLGPLVQIAAGCRVSLVYHFRQL